MLTTSRRLERQDLGAVGERIDVVGPGLHHAGALGQVLGAVVGAAATYAAAGIRAVAITKCDAAAPERVSEVRAEIGAALSGTALADIPHFPLSGLTGKGVAALRAHLEQAAASVTARDDDAPFRLAIDRCFSLAATGTVVTGTAFSGTVKSGDTLYVSPPGIAVRVRSLHVQDRPAICGRAGERCALNIAGPDVDRSRVERGHWLVAQAVHRPVQRFDAGLRLLASEPRALRHWSPVHVHLGAAHCTGRVSLLEAEALVQIVAELNTAEGGVRAALLRDRIGGGRKVAIQILEFFDRIGYSRRVRGEHVLRRAAGQSLFG